MKGRRWLPCLFAALVASSFLMVPAAPSAEAQMRGSHGVNSSFGRGFGHRGVGVGVGRTHRSHRFRNRHSRTKFDRRSNDRRSRHQRFESRKFDDRHNRSRSGRHLDKGEFDGKRFDRDKINSGRNRSKFDPHFGFGVRDGFFATYGNGYGRYDYDRYDDDRDNEYRDDQGGGSEGRSDAGYETPPPPSPPVTPKWIRVDVQVPVDGASTGGAAYAQGSPGADCGDATTEITVNGQSIEVIREDCRRPN